ncbi:MAG: preprotein translocase subunit YajC [Actinomycetota bacterium]
MTSLPLAAASGGGGTSSIFFLVAMVGVFYLLIIRPQQTRARKQRELMGGLGVGDEVVTIGGMFGKIRRMQDDAFQLEIAPGTVVRIARGAVARKVVAEEPGDSGGKTKGEG